MRGKITVPKKIIQGAFTTLFSFQTEIDLEFSDILVETLEGDGLGDPRDVFRGEGRVYYLLCYMPDVGRGRSRISVVKEGVDVVPVEIEYDRIFHVVATWGTPFRRGSKIEIPVLLDTPIRNLRKRHFQVSYPTQCELYGSGDVYSFVVPKARDRFSVSISGGVRKENGVDAVIQGITLVVECSDL